jgi:hypothetical protein
MKAIVRDIRVSLQNSIGQRETSSAEIQQVVEDTLAPFYAKHIDGAPPELRGALEVGFMAGIWTRREGAKLFSVCRTTITEVPYYQCIGAGSYLTEYISEAICPKGRHSVNQTVALAAYIVWAAKKYVESCGGYTSVRALLDNGEDVRVDNREIGDVEEYMVGLFQFFGSMVGFLGDSFSPGQIDMGPYAEILKKQVVECRDKQAVYRDLERKRKATLEEFRKKRESSEK